MHKKILVTGGAGFIGSHLVEYLINQGHEVTIIDDLSGGLMRNVDARAKFVKASIVDAKIVDETVKGKDVIYHLAAYAAEGLSHFIRRYNYTNNLIGSVNLINSAIKHKVERFVFTSSMAVYGSGKPPFDEEDIPKPEDPYGIAKYAVEMDLRVANEKFGLNYTIIRPHNVYGSRQFLGDPYRNVIGIWMNRVMQGKAPLIYGDGKQTRAFSYIEDIIPCLAKAGFLEEKNEIINLGASRAVSLKELAEMVKNAMESDIAPMHVEKRHEVEHAHCTTSKSEKLLGYKESASLEEGLKAMANWAKSVGPMNPIIWEGYELTDGLPTFWQNLAMEYPEANQRINASDLS